jgi:hypothetical protein
MLARANRRKMRFDIVRDPAKIARIQQRLADRNQQLTSSRGTLVRYEMPALPNAFPQLSRVVDCSPHQAEFAGIQYHILTSDGRIEQLLPATEYYKFVFCAVADKRYALELGLGRLRDLEHWIQRYYNEVRDPMLRTEQPSFRVVNQVYALKAELGNLLFLVRGALSTVATLMHFLYGPGSPHFRSFGAFVKYLQKSHAAGTDPDPALREYIEGDMEWFRVLREYRDYVTHYASIEISFYEPQEGVLRAYLHDALQVHDVVAPVLAGLDSFCTFVDGHFAARIDPTGIGRRGVASRSEAAPPPA